MIELHEMYEDELKTVMEADRELYQVEFVMRGDSRGTAIVSVKALEETGDSLLEAWTHHLIATIKTHDIDLNNVTDVRVKRI